MAPSVKSRWWIFETECPDIVADGRDKLWPDRVRFSKWIIIEFVTYDPETGAKVKVESICIAYVEFHTQMRASKGSIIESFFPEARWKREPMIDRMQGLSKLPVLEKMWSAYPTIKGEFEMIYHGPYEFGTWIPIKERLMPKKWEEFYDAHPDLKAKAPEFRNKTVRCETESQPEPQKSSTDVDASPLDSNSQQMMKTLPLIVINSRRRSRGWRPSWRPSMCRSPNHMTARLSATSRPSSTRRSRCIRSTSRSSDGRG